MYDYIQLNQTHVLAFHKMDKNSYDYLLGSHQSKTIHHHIPIRNDFQRHQQISIRIFPYSPPAL